MNLDETELPEPLFEIYNPAQCIIRTTSEHWLKIIHKHPDLRINLENITNCLGNPDYIYASKQDKKIFLSYKKLDKYWVAAVSKRLKGIGFLITAYITDRIKSGEILWQK